MKFGADGQAHWILEERSIEKGFRPAFVDLATALRKANIEVINATPGSGLDVFPEAALDTVLK